ncbi:37S ribosomal protein S9, mitochondrial [Sporothrix stenoceras]|uniref:Small ribosomal subunit protein uS9m n=1 Tax=Sporothrix stenoceras TaxID=5173 RepID=A0ABR3ZJ86_9PEZI
MASLRAGILLRKAANVCSRPWLQLDQQFSLLRVSPAHVASKAAASQILAQTQTRSLQHHRPERPVREMVPESLAGSDLAMDTYIDELTGGSISNIAQSGANTSPTGNAADGVDGLEGLASLTNSTKAKMDGFARAVPASPSYFTRLETITDRLLVLQELFRRYNRLPQVPAEDMKPVAWMSFEHFKEEFGDRVKLAMYHQFMGMVRRLHRIHPKLQPRAVREFVEPYVRDVTSEVSQAKALPIDPFGRALGVGRRKESVARAWVVEGTGEVRVNGKTLSNAFGRVHDRESATWALRATERMDKYNVWALVEGGGTTGQAEALTLAVAKGLVAHEPALKTPLRKAGCITRDPRAVERKKPGHVKARKMPAWVKR